MKRHNILKNPRVRRMLNLVPPINYCNDRNGLTLEIFQFLHEQYIISVEGFIAWEESEKEPEGKAVMLKALTSFFTSIKEADNEDSCGED